MRTKSMQKKYLAKSVKKKTRRKLKRSNGKWKIKIGSRGDICKNPNPFNNRSKKMLSLDDLK